MTRGSYQTKLNIYENNNLFLLQTTLKTTATILQLVWYTEMSITYTLLLNVYQSSKNITA